MLLKDGTTIDVEPLWRAADAGSWVIPQLAVAALFLDADVPVRVRSRVDRLCPIRVPGGLSHVERYSASGPGDARSRSAKLLASLLTVGACLPSLAEWIQAVRVKPEIVALLADDIDNTPVIAKDWLADLVRQFEQRGRHLKPRVV